MTAADAGTSKTHKVLQFIRFQSAVDIVFWPLVAKLKLEEVRLNTYQHIDITGSYTYLTRKISVDSSCKAADAEASVTAIPNTRPPLFSLNEKSFPQKTWSVSGDAVNPKEGTVSPKLVVIPGTLILYNKEEEMISADRKAIFAKYTEQLLEEMRSDEVLRNPGLFSHFILLCFPDVKKYKFRYWFGAPALYTQDQPHQLARSLDQTLAYQTMTDVFSSEEIDMLGTKVQQLIKDASECGNVANQCGGFFLIRRIQPGDTSNECVEVALLSEWDGFFKRPGVYIGFLDPSPSTEVLGWPIRNLLYYASRFKGLETVKIIAIHQHVGVLDFFANSKVVEISLGKSESMSVTVGWEPGVGTTKLSSRVIDVSGTLDPLQRASAAVNLNLQLMRWRAEPAIDLPTIANARCLVLGAGTLGSYVARSLLAWGVLDISFVDNGRVSFSNPVRQPLYEFADCLEGGKFKVDAAAEALKRVYPKVRVASHKLTIPMPGHPISPAEEKQVQDDVTKLEELVQSHDVIFMLTDSRESRWLPTLLAARHNRLLINVALGFDTFMVMRHGIRLAGAPNLSCYFCQDVVAPTDSLSDRTLDEQCTVTRPGLAAMSSALAVELMASVLQHSQRGAALPDSSGSTENRLAQTVPHQIRGFLSNFQFISLLGQPYPNCTACSDKVLAAYAENGFEFLKLVFADPHYLSKVTGLQEMLDGVDALVLTDSDSDGWCES